MHQKQMYVCPHCQSEVVFRRGEKVIPHFAHKVKGSRPCYKTKRMNIIKQKYY